MSLLSNSVMTRHSQAKRETAEWINSQLSSAASSYVSVTLTAKQAVMNADGNLISTKREDMDREVGKFLRRLDAGVYGNASKRYSKKLRRIDASHGGADTFQRLHRHLIIEIPQRFNNDDEFKQFAELIQTAWTKSPYAREIIDVSRTDNLYASVRYLIKDGGADNLSLTNIVL